MDGDDPVEEMEIGEEERVRILKQFSSNGQFKCTNRFLILCNQNDYCKCLNWLIQTEFELHIAHGTFDVET